MESYKRLRDRVRGHVAAEVVSGSAEGGCS